MSEFRREATRQNRAGNRLRFLMTVSIAFLFFFVSGHGTAWAAWVSWLNLNNAYKYSWFSSGTGTYSGVSASSALAEITVARVSVSGTVHEAVFGVSVTHSRRSVSYGCSWRPVPAWESQLTSLPLTCRRQT